MDVPLIGKLVEFTDDFHNELEAARDDQRRRKRWSPVSRSGDWTDAIWPVLDQLRPAYNDLAEKYRLWTYDRAAWDELNAQWADRRRWQPPLSGGGWPVSFGSGRWDRVSIEPEILPMWAIEEGAHICAGGPRDYVGEIAEMLASVVPQVAVDDIDQESFGALILSVELNHHVRLGRPADQARRRQLDYLEDIIPFLFDCAVGYDPGPWNRASDPELVERMMAQAGLRTKYKPGGAPLRAGKRPPTYLHKSPPAVPRLDAEARLLWDEVRAHTVTPEEMGYVQSLIEADPRIHLSKEGEAAIELQKRRPAGPSEIDSAQEQLRRFALQIRFPFLKWNEIDLITMSKSARAAARALFENRIMAPVPVTYPNWIAAAPRETELSPRPESLGPLTDGEIELKYDALLERAYVQYDAPLERARVEEPSIELANAFLALARAAYDSGTQMGASYGASCLEWARRIGS